VQKFKDILLDKILTVGTEYEVTEDRLHEIQRTENAINKQLIEVIPTAKVEAKEETKEVKETKETKAPKKK
jgi:hypothetical protein